MKHFYPKVCLWSLLVFLWIPALGNAQATELEIMNRVRAPAKLQCFAELLDCKKRLQEQENFNNKASEFYELLSGIHFVDFDKPGESNIVIPCDAELTTCNQNLQTAKCHSHLLIGKIKDSLGTYTIEGFDATDAVLCMGK